MRLKFSNRKKWWIQNSILTFCLCIHFKRLLSLKTQIPNDITLKKDRQRNQNSYCITSNVEEIAIVSRCSHYLALFPKKSRPRLQLPCATCHFLFSSPLSLIPLSPLTGKALFLAYFVVPVFLIIHEKEQNIFLITRKLKLAINSIQF